MKKGVRRGGFFFAAAAVRRLLENDETSDVHRRRPTDESRGTSSSFLKIMEHTRDTARVYRLHTRNKNAYSLIITG
jgi:hypothetical protein